VGFVRNISIGVATVLAAACQRGSEAPKQIARSTYGMVVSGAALATDAGRLILESGGNAVDAAVATAFVLAVVEPSMSSLGGRTQMLIRTPGGDFVGIDGTTEVPASAPAASLEADQDAYGYRTIGIPGTVAALVEATDLYGSLPLADLIAPAVQLAEEGFVLSAGEPSRIAGVAGQLRESEGARRHFLKPDGSAYQVGDRLVQPDIARVLRAIAQGGAAVFYRGWIAESIAVDMERNGGSVTLGDLATYRADSALVVRGHYRGYDLVGTYLPASGATTIEALHILEQFDLTGRAGSAEWLALLAQALLLSFEDRVADLGPPEQHARTIVSEEWAASRAAQVRDPAAVTVGSMVGGALTSAVWEPPFTTHLSTADAEGWLVALTQSVGPTMGSKVATSGLGFVYAATMGYLGELEPGERPFSSQSPLLVMQDDRPLYVLGAAGARRIISALVAVVSRIVDQGLPLADAMAEPRFHATPETVYLEMRDQASWPASVVAELRSYGVNPEARLSASYFAMIHGIEYDPATGEYVGVADPRWAGSAVGVRH
jgi:gamma-glutamyltranspeptidase/glutathione hydrolase